MIQGYIYILPSLFFMVCFCLLPIFMSTYFSLTDYDIMTKADFIGLENYKKVFSDKYVVDALKNTFIYVIVTVPVQTFLALVFAAFLADKMQNIVGNFLRSAMFIPVIASSVTAGAIWRTIFGTDGGIINTILGLFGVGEINWLGSSKTALICVCVVAIWKNVGYFLVIYYAGIMGLSPELYEAAKVDGAGKLRCFFSITLPMMKPTIILTLFLCVTTALRNFELIFNLTGGGPNNATTDLVMYAYTLCFRSGSSAGYAMAVSNVLFVIVLIIGLMQQRLLRRETSEL